MSSILATHYQVTALAAIGRYLYVSTTWGCVIVADAETMDTYSVFRCHGDEEFYCKSILQLGPLISQEQFNMQSQPAESTLTETIYKRVPRQNSMQKENRESLQHEIDKKQGIVTIGRGYLDIINRVTRLEKQALVRRDTQDGWAVVNTGSAPGQETMTDNRSKFHTFLLSWEPRHWEFY